MLHSLFAVKGASEMIKNTLPPYQYLLMIQFVPVCILTSTLKHTRIIPGNLLAESSRDFNRVSALLRDTFIKIPSLLGSLSDISFVIIINDFRKDLIQRENQIACLSVKPTDNSYWLYSFLINILLPVDAELLAFMIT